MTGGLRKRVLALQASRILAFAIVPLAAPSFHAHAAQPPEIRLTASNRVPTCVTPQKLMAFLQKRNRNLDPRFKDIASYYKLHGEAWKVRWDYAFYQMAVETNFLTYRRPDGKWGDVDLTQNNFAGIGTTGGGVPGDRFPDVKTGVLGQIQHLVAYSGEHMADPVAARTQLKQDDIILESQKLARPVKFSDLARRWAVDPKYGSSIEWVADGFRSEFCKGGSAEPLAAASTEVLPWAKASGGAAAVPAPKPAVKRVLAVQSTQVPPLQGVAPVQAAAVNPDTVARTIWVSSPRGQPKPAMVNEDEAPAAGTVASPVASLAPPSGLGVKPPLTTANSETQPCLVTTASYGGKKSVLIKDASAKGARYTVLTVLDGFEKSMTDSFIKSRAPSGLSLGEFPDQNTALAHARQLCPGS